MQAEEDWTGINHFTEDFDLEIALQESQLKVRIKDFRDWNVYQKIYTESDIGSKQIHKKADLSDIFQVLAPSLKQKYSSKINMGLFSSMQNDNSFEVKQGGQISIYLNLQLLNSDKLIQCKSNLALNRKRKMTDIQIWNYRFALKMNQICFRQMEALRIKNSTFRQALSTLKDSYHDISRKIHEIQEQRKNKIILDEKKAEEESLKIRNGKYRLKSLHGNYLGGHEKHWIYTTNNTCKWEEWHIQWKEDHFQIKSFHNTFLSSTPEGKTQLEKTISTWEHWQIIPNGNQYLLRSVRGTYLSENKQKQIYLSDQPNYEQKWKLIS